MTGVLATLIVLVLIVLMALAGLRDGIFFTTYALTRNLFAFFCGLTFCEPGARLLTEVFSNAHPAYEYFVALSFAAIVGAVFVVGRTLKVTYTVPYVPCPAVADKVGGPVLGVLNAVVVSGTLLVLWSLLPFAKYIPGDLGDARVKSRLLDTGAAMLRVYGCAEQRMGGDPLPLEDEPVLNDINGNGRPDLVGESYDDRNHNGRWDRGWLWKYKNHAVLTPSDLEALPGVLSG